ncbi:hypothetical protein pneo_cds_329 [Pandoravirus neocaledonia]|uniref:Uncharacterized protein n=1 Tax=Pandoravirus neocaledonia TaxID=2107708 RepID=A0A2U7UBW9_9VIRU|nr:hypothetical protein pneo_cds_329 [Pandoravirus neocaledonia]AVK75936.1 hypothetical protein pneo_cds_329 [Pandoravirus neocaledonia]
MSHTESMPTGQIVKALAAADPSVSCSMRSHGLDTLERVFGFVSHDARMAALSTALAVGNAEILGEIVAAFQRDMLDKAINDLPHDPGAVHKICEASRRRDDVSDNTYYTGNTLISNLAIEGHIESLAVVIRHSAHCHSFIKRSIRDLGCDCKWPRPNLHATRTLLDVCANESRIDPETQACLLIDALVHCASEFAHDIIDILAPMCTSYVLRETLLRCSGDGVSYYAFDNIWRVAEGAVCVHRMARDLGGGNARIHMRRCIRDLGKGRPCKSVGCIYGPPCASDCPEPPRQDAFVHRQKYSPRTFKGGGIRP